MNNNEIAESVYSNFEKTYSAEWVLRKGTENKAVNSIMALSRSIVCQTLKNCIVLKKIIIDLEKNVREGSENELGQIKHLLIGEG